MLFSLKNLLYKIISHNYNITLRFEIFKLENCLLDVKS